MGMTLRVGVVAVVVLVWAGTAAACPVCQSDTGRQVRAGIFGDRFAANLVLTLLPVPILAGLVALIHYGFPNPKSESPVRSTPGAGENDPKRRSS